MSAITGIVGVLKYVPIIISAIGYFFKPSEKVKRVLESNTLLQEPSVSIIANRALIILMIVILGFVSGADKAYLAFETYTMNIIELESISNEEDEMKQTEDNFRPSKMISEGEI